MSEYANVRLLSAVVERYDETEAPVTPSQLRECVDGDESAIRSRLEALRSNHLLTAVEDGYRPTVTGRELLDLDFDRDSMLVLDSDPCE